VAVPCSMTCRPACRPWHAPRNWEGPDAVLEKVDEEVDELREALDVWQEDDDRPSPRAEEEIGDLLFALSSLARHLGISPEVALRRAAEKFERRFRAIEPRVTEADAGDPEVLDRLWEEQKSRERRGGREGAD